jgi:hypothetical protein
LNGHEVLRRRRIADTLSEAILGVDDGPKPSLPTIGVEACGPQSAVALGMLIERARVKSVSAKRPEAESNL